MYFNKCINCGTKNLLIDILKVKFCLLVRLSCSTAKQGKYNNHSSNNNNKKKRNIYTTTYNKKINQAIYT